MKKFYLFMTSALLAAMPAVAQDDGLERFPDDPKVIFNQDFEVPDGVDADEAWDVWSNTAVDTIKEITYFNKIATGSVSGADIYDGSVDYQVFMVRTDSIIPLKNGVVTSNDKNDKANSIYANEDYGLVYDGGQDPDRNEAFSKYGQNGGKYYFSYTSADATGADTYSSSAHKVDNYRRNLFVRGLNIEDQSSYRLTFYIKATPKAKVAPYFYADIMRGYYNSEKPFSMGLKDDASNYQYNNRFEFEKTDFNGQWEKVTYMTYYLNDSIADGYVYRHGYYWYNKWNWRPTDAQLAAAGKTLKAGDTLTCINQPDKFFVRLSFSSDSTEFLLDNMSLTKSWIAGVEHDKDMLRVDFGYETNLKELAKKAEAETGIAAIELGGEYFKVMGYRKASGKWTAVDINSAEYHDDGYMYMWTKPYVNPQTGKVTPSLFNVYDSVRVSFTNPDDEALRLNYNGKLFPMALDTTWIKAGKKVHDFRNELSTPNPNIGKGVYSMKNLPPKMVGAPYEDGSFGLDPITSITVNYTRKLEFDDEGETSELGWLRVTKSGVKEVWTISESTDSTTTYVRSAADIAKGALNGDYTFEFVNIKGENTDYAKNVTLSYGFGEFDHNPSSDLPALVETDWRAEAEANQCVPKGITIWDANTTFAAGQGQGKNISSKSRLYFTNPETSNGFDCGLYFSSRGASAGGHVFYGYDDNYKLTLDKGVYTLSFSASKWDGYDNIPVTIYIYPRSLSANPQLNAIDPDQKTKIAVFESTKNSTSGNVQKYDDPYGTWDQEEFDFTFTISAADDYVIEWNSAMGASGNAKNYGGCVMSNFKIFGSPGLSYTYVSKLNKTVQAALDKIDYIDDNEEVDGQYHGDQYDELGRIAEFYSYENWEDTKPSAYMAAAAAVQAEIDKMQLRMDTVDLYYKTEDKVYEKLGEFEDDDKVDFQDLAAYVTLSEHIEANDDWDCSVKTNAEIKAEIDLYEAEIKALDDRVALIGKYDEKVAQIKDSIDKSVFKYFDEFTVMQNTYQEITSSADRINDSDDVLTGYYNTLCSVYNNFIFKPEFLEAETRQIKELFAFAESMGYDFGGKKDEIKRTVDNLQANDPALENMLREASILQVYKALAANADTIAEGLDVSVLIPNYYMATKAEANVDMRKNSSGKWVVKSSPSTTVIPEWTITFAGSYGSSGSCYPGREAMDWENNGHEFIAGIHFENNTTGSASTTVSGLPAGIYTVNVNMIQNNLSNSKFNFVTDSVKLELKGSKSASPKTFSQENVWVPTKSNLSITYTITGASGSGHVDVGSAGLILTAPDEKANYADLIVEQQNKLNELILFADAPQAEQIGVEYINLNGIAVEAPQAGEILIKRIILSNGQVETQIELIK